MEQNEIKICVYSGNDGSCQIYASTDPDYRIYLLRWGASIRQENHIQESKLLFMGWRKSIGDDFGIYK